MTRRRRIIRGIATIVIGAFLAAGIAYLAHDVEVDPPVAPALIPPSPADTAISRHAEPKDTAKVNKKTKEKKPQKPQRKPVSRSYLDEKIPQ